MSSTVHGIATSNVEVTNVSSHGIWLLVADREHFLSFEDFPWFKDAPIGNVLNVRQVATGHFRWPDLDVDLSLESIENPDKYPLIST